MTYAVADAHVHLHGEASVSLRMAATNLLECAPRPAGIGVLFLTETSGENRFEALRTQAERRADPAVAIGGHGSIWWHGHPPLPLLLVAGRQIVTAEGLEVLALGTARRLGDGLPLATVLAWCGKEAAIPVLPWGAGKWLGRRGRIVRELVAAPPQRLMLGDNAGRPALWPEPAFAAAARRGMRVLPGSDPLPLDGSHRGIGRFGFGMEIDLDRADPCRSTLDALRRADKPIEPFGAPCGLRRFIADQAALRWRRPGRRFAR